MSKTFTSILLILSVLFIYSANLSGDIKLHNTKPTQEKLYYPDKGQKEMSFLEYNTPLCVKTSIYEYDLVYEMHNDYIKIRNCIIGDDDAKLIAKFIKENNKTMKKIILSFNKISDVGLEELAKALEGNSIIEEIIINRNVLEFNAANEFAKLLKNNQSIKQLILNDNTISFKAFNKLAGALKENKMIYNLSFEGTNIDKDSFEVLATALKFNKFINFLNLGNCGLRNDDANHLAQILKNFNIRMLDFSDNKIDESGIKIFVESLKGFSRPEVEVYLSQVLIDNCKKALDWIRWIKFDYNNYFFD